MGKRMQVKAGGYKGLIGRIANILSEARTRVVREVDKIQVLAYWEIGREIVEFEQKGKRRAEYGTRLIMRVARDMTYKFGRGFGKSNVFLMRQFYLTYPKKFQTVSGKLFDIQKFQTADGISKIDKILSWSCYCELLKVEEPLTRSFYEKEAIYNGWKVRELRRQINSMLFERLALSRNVKKVIKMARKGHIIEKPEDTIKDPYILEFLNLKEDSSYTESQLEQALIDKLQYFLLELGKGFSFVARQKKITIANKHYYIDLVFYNRILKCFMLIDIKTEELSHADIGQMNFYLNYFAENEKINAENDPIGLILCAKKNDIFAKYVLRGLTNKLFASKYKLALPLEKELSRKLKSMSYNNRK